MKKVLCAFVFLLIAAAAPAVHASDAMKAIVGSYLEIQTALAADKTDGVKEAAGKIAEQATRMGPDGQAILKAAKAVENGLPDIKEVRPAFGDLSDAVIARAKAEGWKDLPDTKLAYCPMARKSWLQKEATISNPYYGKSMLTCGEFKKK
jgi:hypothetical protein